MKNIFKIKWLLLSLCLTIGIVGCDNNKNPKKAVVKTKNKQKKIPKSIVPKKSENNVHIEKTKLPINQPKSVNYNAVKNKHQRDSGKLDFNLMTNEELNKYAYELLENGNYDEIIKFINLSRDRISNDYVFKDLAIALYSNLIANASSEEQIISHNSAIGSLLYYYYVKGLVSAPPKEAQSYLEAVFNAIPVGKYEDQLRGIIKYLTVANLANIYIYENKSLEDSFKLLKDARQTYEINKNAISKRNKEAIDIEDEDFLQHITYYLRKHPKIKYSDNIVRQIKEELSRYENTPGHGRLNSNNLRFLHDFIKNKEDQIKNNNKS